MGFIKKEPWGWFLKEGFLPIYLTITWIIMIHSKNNMLNRYTIYLMYMYGNPLKRQNKCFQNGIYMMCSPYIARNFQVFNLSIFLALHYTYHLPMKWSLWAQMGPPGPCFWSSCKGPHQRDEGVDQCEDHGSLSERSLLSELDHHDMGKQSVE